jgi:hypothetical protein
MAQAPNAAALNGYKATPALLRALGKVSCAAVQLVLDMSAASPRRAPVKSTNFTNRPKSSSKTPDGDCRQEPTVEIGNRRSRFCLY